MEQSEETVLGMTQVDDEDTLEVTISLREDGTLASLPDLAALLVVGAVINSVKTLQVSIEDSLVMAQLLLPADQLPIDQRDHVTDHIGHILSLHNTVKQLEVRVKRGFLALEIVTRVLRAWKQHAGEETRSNNNGTTIDGEDGGLSLESLQLFGNILKASPQDMQDLAQTLSSGFPHMGELELLGCSIQPTFAAADGGVDNNNDPPLRNSLDPLIHQLTSSTTAHPSLHGFHLAMLDPTSLVDQMSDSALDCLCRCSTLEALTLSLSEDQLLVAQKALCEASTLRGLYGRLTDGLTVERGGRALHDLLANITSLQAVVLNFPTMVSEDVLIQIIEGLVKGTVTGLVLKFDQHSASLPNVIRDQSMLEEWTKKLEGNFALEKFEVRFTATPDYTTTVQSVTPSREANDVPRLQELLEAYAKLNKAGRVCVMLHQDQPKVWVETMANVFEDVPCLYYFLSKNPALLLSCNE